MQVLKWRIDFLRAALIHSVLQLLPNEVGVVMTSESESERLVSHNRLNVKFMHYRARRRHTGVFLSGS